LDGWRSWPPITLAHSFGNPTRLKERSQMQHDENGHQVCGDDHERQLCHRASGHFPGDAGGNECAGANGYHEIQYSQHIPYNKGLARREAGLSNEGD